MKNFLPIGSIVRLKNGTKRVMIYGRKQLSNDFQTFDYVACFYPEGNISDEYTFLFNHDQIEEVYHEGYSDADELAFVNNVLNNPEFAAVAPQAITPEEGRVE